MDQSQPQVSGVDVQGATGDFARADRELYNQQQWIAQSDAIQSKRLDENYARMQTELADAGGRIIEQEYPGGSYGDYVKAMMPAAPRVSAARELQLERDRESARFAELSGNAGRPSVILLPKTQSLPPGIDVAGVSSSPGAYMTAYEPQAVRATEIQQGALLNYLDGQGRMALGGVTAAGVMISTNNVVGASATTDVVEPLDNLVAPMGNRGGTALARVRGRITVGENNAVGNSFDEYVVGTKLRGLDELGLLGRQERLPTPDLDGRVYIKPDYTIYRYDGRVAAYGDAKTGAEIPFDAQARGLVDWSTVTTSKTLIYYTPDGNTPINSYLLNYARQQGVQIKQVGVK